MKSGMERQTVLPCGPPIREREREREVTVPDGVAGMVRKQGREARAHRSSIRRRRRASVWVVE
jgi:hypothetical protein